MPVAVFCYSQCELDIKYHGYFPIIMGYRNHCRPPMKLLMHAKGPIYFSSVEARDYYAEFQWIPYLETTFSPLFKMPSSDKFP